MDESAQFTAKNKQNKQAGSFALLMKYPKQVAIVVGMSLGGTISFYSYTTYMQQFMINSAGMDKETVAMINFLVLLVMVALQPLFSHLSDKIGRRPLLIFFGIGGTLLTVPLFTLLAHVSTALQAFLLMLTGGGSHCLWLHLNQCHSQSRALSK